MDSEGNKVVKIDMSIGSHTLIFGVPMMLTLIILGTLVVGRFALPQPVVHVDAPSVQAHMPAPNVYNQIEQPKPSITVNVPGQPPPVVNVSTPTGEPSKVTVTLPDGKTEIRTVEKVVEKPVDRFVYVYVDTREKANVTLDDVIASAEKYLQKSATFAADHKKWLDLWLTRVKERGDEQALFNECLIEKRGGFDVAKAQPPEVCEVCRLMLRVRDARLAVPEAFKNYLTAANLAVFKAFLDKP